MHSSPARAPELQLAAGQPSTGKCWIPPERDTPHPRAKEKPQQDGSRGEITFRIKSLTCQTLRGFKQTLCTPGPRDPRDWARTVFGCLLRRYGSAVACRRGRGSGCSTSGCGISPLGGGRHSPHYRATRTYTGLWIQTLGRQK